MKKTLRFLRRGVLEGRWVRGCAISTRWKTLANGQAPHPDRSVQIVDGATGARWPIRLQP